MQDEAMAKAKQDALEPGLLLPEAGVADICKHNAPTCRKCVDEYEERDARRNATVAEGIVRVAELEVALADLLGCDEEPCQLVHHSKDDRHFVGEPCPVLARYRCLIATVAAPGEVDRE